MRDQPSYVLSLLVILVITLLSCYHCQSVAPILTSSVVFILSLRLGVSTGESNLFKGIMETFLSEGYLVYVDKDDEIVIERKYGDHWYKNK